MKLPTKVSKVTGSDGLEKNEFTIQASRKAFEILSSGLYSNKIRAVVRELCANAADAHTAIGKKDLPFHVQLPTSFEPYFSVTDEGPGLSDEEIKNQYTTYFSSTKTESNDVTGCLGLGSKAPFAYTDNFSVTSNKDGVCTFWAMFLNEHGVPSLTKLGTSYTTKTGLQIKLTVKHADFNNFITEAKSVLKWFNPHPVITGANITLEAPAASIMTGNGWAIHQARTNTNLAIMGNIAYPIDWTKVPTKDISPSLLQWGCTLWFEIGELDVAASREALSYIPLTIRTLEKRAQEVFSAIKEKAQKDLDSCPTIWQARKRAHELKNSLFGNVGVSLSTWRGKLCHYIIPVPEDCEIDLYTRDSWRDKVLIHNSTELVARDIPIYINDTPGNFRARLSHKIITHGGKAFLIKKATKEFMEETGVEEVLLKTSTLPDPPVATSNNTRQKGDKAKVLLYKSVAGHANSSFWEKTKEEPTQSSDLYTVIRQYIPRGTDGTTTVCQSWHIKSKLDYLEVFIGKPRLFGVRPSDVKKMSGVKNLWECLEEIKNKHQDDILSYGEWFASKLQVSLLLEHYKEIPSSSGMRVFLDWYKERVTWNNSKTVAALIGLFDYPNRYNLPSNRYTTKWEETTKIYPMLRHTVPDEKNILDIIEYIKVVNK